MKTLMIFSALTLSLSLFAGQKDPFKIEGYVEKFDGAYTDYFLVDSDGRSYGLPGILNGEELFPQRIASAKWKVTVITAKNPSGVACFVDPCPDFIFFRPDIISVLVEPLKPSTSTSD